MKVTDYTQIMASVQTQIAAIGDFWLADYVGSDMAEWAVASVYMSSNLTKAFTMHMLSDYASVGIGDITVITTPHRVSIIYDGRKGTYDNQTDICLFEDLDTDIQNIVYLIQLVMQMI